MRKIRMTSREIVESEEIIDVLMRCEVLRIAFRGDEYPYVVPVSFGVKRDGDDIVVYFHGAKEGKKAELIEKDPKVWVEGDIFYKAEETSYGITAKYESVMGFGIIEKVEGEELMNGLQAICAHYGFADYALKDCQTLPMVNLYRIKAHGLTGKRKLPD